jgi:ribonuclease-3
MQRPLSRADAPSMGDQDAGGHLDGLQEALGYRFRDLDLLRRALTHPSYVAEHALDRIGDNQRLEFLGDAVVDFVAAAWVFRRYPEFDEGPLTRLRIAMVRTETLAQVARQVGIPAVLRLGYGEEEMGGRDRETNLCDAFEAVVGAIYLDSGPAVASRVIEPLLAPVAESTLAQAADRDAKSLLQEWSQAELSILPRYRIIDEAGPDHAKTFVAEVLLEDQVLGRGTGTSKQAAQQAAAQAALDSRDSHPHECTEL